MLRKILAIFERVFFGIPPQEELPPLSDDQKFMLQQLRLGFITEGEWLDLLDQDPVLAAHYRFHHPEMPRKAS